MLNKEINDMLKDMNYEKQKEVLHYLKDDQSYDSCNVIEILVDATIEAVKAIGRLLFK